MAGITTKKEWESSRYKGTMDVIPQFDLWRLEKGIADKDIRIDYYSTDALLLEDGELARAMLDQYNNFEKQWDAATYHNQTEPAAYGDLIRRCRPFPPEPSLTALRSALPATSAELSHLRADAANHRRRLRRSQRRSARGPTWPRQLKLLSRHARRREGAKASVAPTAPTVPPKHSRPSSCRASST